MNEIDEREKQMTEDKHGRRSFFKQASKYLLGIGTFGIASLFGLRRNGDLRLGKMKETEFGLSEAHGACGMGMGCSGGGGQCGMGMGCSGGGGQCGTGMGCSGGGGQCGMGMGCGGS